MHNMKISGKCGDHNLTFSLSSSSSSSYYYYYCIFGLLLVAKRPGSQILKIPLWFLPVSGNQIITCNYRFCDSNLFIFLPSPTLFWNNISFVWGCSDGKPAAHLLKKNKYKNKYKSNCRKNGNYNQLFGWHVIISRRLFLKRKETIC